MSRALLSAATWAHRQARSRAALTGEVASELAEPEKAENEGERGYGRLMEVYVPIRLPKGRSGLGIGSGYLRVRKPLRRLG